MDTPPDLSGGNITETVGLVTDAVITHEIETRLIKRGVGSIITNLIVQGAGGLISTIYNVLDPTYTGDGTMTGHIQRQNAGKIKRINNVLDNR